VRQGGTRKRCVICRALGHKRNTCPHAPPLEQQPTPSATQEGTTATEQTQASQPTESLQPSQHTQPTQPTDMSGAQQSQITASKPVVPAATNQQQSHPTQATQNSSCQQTQVPQPSQITSTNQIQPTTTTTFREKLSFRRGPITKP